jgi:hypothetical protein
VAGRNVFDEKPAAFELNNLSQQTLRFDVAGSATVEAGKPHRLITKTLGVVCVDHA